MAWAAPPSQRQTRRRALAMTTCRASSSLDDADGRETSKAAQVRDLLERPLRDERVLGLSNSIS